MGEHRHLFDSGAAALIGATFVGWLPAIAAGFAIIWYAIQIFDRCFVKRK